MGGPGQGGQAHGEGRALVVGPRAAMMDAGAAGGALGQQGAERVPGGERLTMSGHAGKSNGQSPVTTLVVTDVRQASVTYRAHYASPCNLICCLPRHHYEHSAVT